MMKCPKCGCVHVTKVIDNSGVSYYVCGDCDHAWWC